MSSARIPVVLDESEAALRRRSRLDRAPGWIFHATCVLVAGVVLWSATVPAVTVVGLLVGFYGIGALGLAWLVRLGVVLLRTRRAGRGFAVAPLGGLLLVVLLVTSAPLHARWAVSKSAFEDAVRSDRSIPAGEVERVGTYPVLSIDEVGGGTVFTLASASFLDAGFAHLPDGPAELLAAQRFESPEFVPLGDGWYRWTSSW